MKTEDLHGSAYWTTPSLDVGGELDPILGIPSGRRRTPVRRGTLFGSAVRKRVRLVPRGSELIACLDEPGRSAEDRPDHVTGYHGAKRSHEIAKG